jgi:uncharacterized protein (DUF486 family)
MNRTVTHSLHDMTIALRTCVLHVCEIWLVRNMLLMEINIYISINFVNIKLIHIIMQCVTIRFKEYRSVVGQERFHTLLRVSTMLPHLYNSTVTCMKVHDAFIIFNLCRRVPWDFISCTLCYVTNIYRVDRKLWEWKR